MTLPSLAELAAAVPAPRLVWVMVPSGAITTSVITELATVLEDGDLVIEGGNSRFTEDAKHAALLVEKGIHYVDCGVSGGIWGHQNGYGLMAGGDERRTSSARFRYSMRCDRRVRATRDSSTPARSVPGTTRKWCTTASSTRSCRPGPKATSCSSSREDLIKDVTGTFKAWQRGTVVRSWLLELLVKALEEDPEFEDIEGYVEDSGEGRWTVEEALNNAVPVPTISASIFARFVSRQKDSPSMKAVAALRKQFGGHAVRKA